MARKISDVLLDNLAHLDDDQTLTREQMWDKCITFQLQGDVIFEDWVAAELHPNVAVMLVRDASSNRIYLHIENGNSLRHRRRALMGLTLGFRVTELKTLKGMEKFDKTIDAARVFIEAWFEAREQPQ